MKTMKKTLCFFLAALLITLSFAGCSESGETNTDTGTPDAAENQTAQPGTEPEPEERSEEHTSELQSPQ